MFASLNGYYRTGRVRMALKRHAQRRSPLGLGKAPEGFVFELGHSWPSVLWRTGAASAFAPQNPPVAFKFVMMTMPHRFSIGTTHF